MSLGLINFHDIRYGHTYIVIFGDAGLVDK